MSRRWDRPGITIHVEPPSEARDDALVAELDRLLDGAGPSSVLVLASHRLVRDRLIHRLTRDHPKGRILPSIRTVGAFALDAAETEGAAPATPGLRRVLLAELIGERRGAKALRSARDLPGLVRAIDHFFQALGRQRIWTSATLNTLVHVYRRGRTHRIDEELVALYERYRDLFPIRASEKATLTTPIEVLGRVVDGDASVARHLRGVRRIFVVGFDELTPLNTALIGRVAASEGVESTTLLLETIDEESATDADWTRHFGDVAVHLSTSDEAVTPAARLAVALARGRTEEAHDVGDQPEPSRRSLTEYDSPRAEVDAIARHVADRLRAGDAPSTVAVGFPTPERMLPLVRDLFPRHGVPFQTTVGVPLASAPPVATTLALLRTVEGGFDRTAIERLLQSPYLRPTERASDHLLDVDTCARAARVTGGRGRPDEDWLAPLGALRSRPPRHRPDDETIDAALTDLRTFFRAVEGLTRTATRRVPVDRFLDALTSAITDLGIDRPFGDPALEAADVRDAAATARFRDATSALTQAVAFVTPEPTHTLSEWIERLETVLAEETLLPAEETVGGVAVVSLHDLRHLGADTVFLGGLTDDDLPRRSRSDLLYPTTHDAARDFLPPRDFAAEDAASFFGEIGRRAELHLSWSGRVDAIETMRSTLLDRLTDVSTHHALPAPRSALLPEERVIAWTRALADASSAADGPVEPTLASLTRSALHALHASERRRLERPSPHTGFLSIGEYADRAGAAFAPGGSHTYSAGSLEDYATCAYRYFARHVLKLSEIDETEEDLTPPMRGLLLHDILHRFYDRRLKRGDDAAISEDNVESVRDELIRIATTALRDIPDDDLLWQADRDSILGTKGRRPALLAQFLDAEIERWRLGWRPKSLEWAFGMGERPPMIVETERGPVKIRGKVDRVDQNDAGDTIVLDYKSGQMPRAGDVDDGTRFQLPIYLMASHRPDTSGGWDAAYYSLRPRDGLQPRGNLSGARRGRHGNVDVDELRTEVARRLGSMATAIAAGSFPLTTLDGKKSPCRYCRYRSLCRVEGTSAGRRRDLLGRSSAQLYQPKREPAC